MTTAMKEALLKLDTDTSDYEQLFLNDVPMIDTRAPVEFQQGAFPSSTSLPLMSDDERAQVGTCYKQQGQQAAIELGHQLVSGDLKQQRLKSWTDFARQHPEGYIYCFRGGLRSHTARQWMHEAGVDYPLITGGYKAMRRFLIEVIEQQAKQRPLLILSGRTGTGKTRVIDRVAESVDLEGFANHRGSSFGRRVTPQPSQIDFENALAVRLLKLKHRCPGPLMLEDESRLIGRISIPLDLHDAMGQAPIVVLEESMALRVEQVKADYVDALSAEYVDHNGPDKGLQAYSNYMLESLHRVRKRLGMERTTEIRELMQQALEHQIKTGNTDRHDAWIERMLGQYYDPMYDYQLGNKQDRVLFRGNQAEVIDWFADYRADQS